MIQPIFNLDTFAASKFLFAPFIMNLDMDLDGLDITEFDPPVMAASTASVFSLPSGTSDMFATPSSTASGSTGGKVGTELGLVFVVDISDVCGGVISGPGHSVMRFCSKTVGDCQAKGHRTKKVLLKNETFYIKHTRTGQARLEPSLPKDALPEELHAGNLLVKAKPFVEWAAYFEGLEAKKESEDLKGTRSVGSTESWEKIETPSIEAYSKAHRSLKTPKRLRLGDLQAIDVETIPMTRARFDKFSPVEGVSDEDEGEVLQAKIQTGLRTVFAEWNRLESTFNVIHLKFNSDATGEQKYREAVQKTLLDMQQCIREADARIQVIHASIGQDAAASEDATITVWEAIAALKKGLERVTGDSEASSEFLTQAKNNLPMLATNLEKLKDHYTLNMPKINRGLASTQARLSTLETPRAIFQGTDFYSRVGQRGGAPDVTDVDALDDRDDQLRMMKAELLSTIDQVKADVSTLGLDLANHHGGGQAAARLDLDDLLTEHGERLGDLEARTSGEGFASGDFVFNSEASVSDWLIAEKVPNAGCFWDLFSVLACMSPKRQRGKDKADETYSAKRIQSTQLDNDLLAAMTHERPDVLYARKIGGEPGALEDGFVACPSYKAWITGTESYRSKLTKDLRQFCTAVEGSMVKGTAYKSLAMSLISEVKTQWSTLCSFVDSFYIELTGVANFPKEKAWKLTGRCVAAVFTSMGSYRASVSRLDDLVPLENKASCLWGVLQCHRVVQEFEKVDYRGHPGVVTEMNLFLLIERIDPTIIISNEEKIKRLETENKAANSEVKRLDEKCKKLDRDFANLNTAVVALRAKVNKS